MDFSLDTRIPMSYNYGPSLAEQAKEMMSLAEAMDKRKMNKMAMDAEYKKRAAQEMLRKQAQSDLSAYQDVPGLPPAPVEPAAPTAYQAIKPADIYRQIQGDIGAIKTPAQQRMLSEGVKAQYGLDISPETVAQIQGPQPPIGGVGPMQPPSISEEQFGALPGVNKPGGIYGDVAQEYQTAKDKYGTDMQGYQTSKAEYDAAVEQQAPENRIPKGYQWMDPKEYETFLRRAAVDPDLGDAYVEKLVGQREKLSIAAKNMREQAEKDKTAAEQRALEMEIKRHGLVSRIFTGAKTDKGEYDQNSVATAVARAREMGFDVDRLPDNPTKDQIEDWIAEDIAMKKDSKSKDPYVEQKARFNQEKDLRESFQSQAKPFVGVRNQYASLRSIDTSTPQGQMALIYSIMKMYDPGSVVREGEYATAQNATGVPDAIRNMWNKAIDGNGLNPTQISNFVKQGESIYKAALQNFDTLKNQYGRVSMDYGIKPSNVTGGLDLAEKEAKPVFKF
jgi:hypothetical protein